MTKRLLAFLLCMVMTVSLLPVSVFAEETETSYVQEAVETVMDHAKNIMLNVRNGGKITFKMSADADSPDAIDRCRNKISGIISADGIASYDHQESAAIDADRDRNEISSGQDVDKNSITGLFRKTDISEEDGIVTILLEAKCSEEVTAR